MRNRELGEGGVVRRRPGRPQGAGAGAAAAAGRGRNAAPAAVGGVRSRAAPVAAPARNVRPRRGVPDPPESSGSERGDSADETETEVDEAELEVEEAEPEPEEIEGGRRPRRRNRRDQEGASLVPFHFTPDAELSVKWGWVLTEEIQPIVDAISDQNILKLSFVSLFGQQYQQPHFAACLEFIRTYDTDTHTGTGFIPAHLIFYVRTKIEGSVEEDYYLTAFTLEMLRHEIVQVRLHLDRTRHQRYLITFLGIPLTTILAHARVIDPAETSTQPQPVPTREVVQEAVIRQRVIQDLGASSSQTAEELQQQVTELEARRANLQETIARMSSVEDPRPRLVAPESIRGKVLILDLNSLLVRYCTQEQADSTRLFGHQPVQLPSRSWYVHRVGLITFLEAVRREFTLIFWTSRMKHNADALLRDLEERGLILARFFLTEMGGGGLYLKRFARLYYYNLASRDVLLVDDSVKKNSTNSPFSAIHPHSFTPWREDHAPHLDQFLCGTLLPWLQAWRQSLIPTPAYVRHHYAELGAQDPFEGLRSYWGRLVQGEHSSLLFCDATAHDQAIARSLFIGDVPVAEASVAVAGVDDVPVAAATVADVPVAAAGVDVIPVAIPIVDDSHVV
ncbi:hypothetical protein R1sor_015826 [Riccia sorocarpa]|uniref:FCP1 homology domain-containing protein n=1 Tax=Riccia sorocarpa TaxID=122646 RepID=A0ABD3HGE8_9MARC